MIFIVTSSPVLTVMICGVKLAPTEHATHSPIFSTSYFDLLNELAGLTFLGFSAEKSITGGDGAAEDIGLGERAMVTVPSGPYFLGLPRFFFRGNAGGGAGAGGCVAGGGGADVGVGFSDLGAMWNSDGASDPTTVTPVVAEVTASLVAVASIDKP